MNQQLIDRGTSIPIVRWEEFRLIIARRRGGQTAVGINNLQRGAAPTHSGGTAAEIKAQVINERQELFHGHRLGDVVR
jgi:molecular chaperone DnaK (HSP70)